MRRRPPLPVLVLAVLCVLAGLAVLGTPAALPGVASSGAGVDAAASAGPTSGRAADAAAVRHVVQVSLDGVRPVDLERLGADRLPTLFRLVAEGASTFDARSDADVTKTLPNHTSQLTGRPVLGLDGHGVTTNQDAAGQTVHAFRGAYVASVFDVVHDHGLRTGLFAGKEKFGTIARSYDAEHGAPDRTGRDDGRAKLDVVVRDDSTALVAAWLEQMGSDPFAFSLLHLRDPDVAGHEHGWGSAAYDAALEEVDGLLGRVVAGVTDDARLRSRTVVLVTSDHGGDAFEHADPTRSVNQVVPFVAWGATVGRGVDLYAVNAATHVRPGATDPAPAGVAAPVRGHLVANLALDLLGLPPVPGSVIDVAQTFRLGGDQVQHAPFG